MTLLGCIAIIIAGVLMNSKGSIVLNIIGLMIIVGVIKIYCGGEDR